MRRDTVTVKPDPENGILQGTKGPLLVVEKGDGTVSLYLITSHQLRED